MENQDNMEDENVKDRYFRTVTYVSYLLQYLIYFWTKWEPPGSLFFLYLIKFYPTIFGHPVCIGASGKTDKT